MRVDKIRERALFFCKAHWFLIIVLLGYLFFSAYYMGPGFTDCRNSIYGFGDSTAGPIWRNSFNPEQPLFGGQQTKTNYPYGESLYSPVGFASSVQTITMGALSKVTTPVCAYNLYNIIGYVTTGLVIYLFVMYLTRNRWVAALAGYAVSFTPYVQSKIGGHPNYAFAGVLVGIIWAAIHLLRTRSWKAAVTLGVLLATCAYLDPYFTLFAVTIVSPILVVWFTAVWLARGRRKELGLKQYLKPFAIALIVFVVLLAPLAIIRVKDAGTIDQSVSKSRGNILAAATLCSNKPLDYLLPDPNNIHLQNIFGPNYTAKNIKHRDWCGYAESRVSLSLILLTIGAVSLAVYIVRERKRVARVIKGSEFVNSNSFVVACLIGIGISALLLGLPPYLSGHITPSGIILKVTTMWRIFAREYLVVNVAMVLVAAIGMAYLTRLPLLAGRKFLRAILFVFVFAGVIAEYQINPPFQPMTFSYARDIPGVYRRIQHDGSIKVIAEYPMDRIGIEYDSVVYYMTMQGVHEKSMVNSVLSTDSRETTHASLKDLSDPQTIPALRYLGVDHIVVHGESTAEVLAKTGGQLSLVDSSSPAVYGLKMVRDEPSNDILLFKINAGPTDNNILTVESGGVVNLPLIQSPVGTQYEVVNNTVLRETQLGSVQSTNNHACFDVRMSADSDSGNLDILQGDKVVRTVHIAGIYSHIVLDVSSGQTIKLVNDKGYNMRIDNLNGECSE